MDNRSYATQQQQAHGGVLNKKKSQMHDDGSEVLKLVSQQSRPKQGRNNNGFNDAGSRLDPTNSLKGPAIPSSQSFMSPETSQSRVKGKKMMSITSKQAAQTSLKPYDDSRHNFKTGHNSINSYEEEEEEGQAVV